MPVNVYVDMFNLAICVVCSCICFILSLSLSLFLVAALDKTKQQTLDTIGQQHM